MKLELKHITPYLPYKLRVVEWYRGKQIHDEFVVDCVNWDGKNIGGSDASLDSFELERMFNLKDIKPILRPMANLFTDEFKDLRDDISDYELDVIFTWFVSELKPTNPLICISYYVATLLFEHHFDIFGLIDKGLAIERRDEQF